MADRPAPARAELDELTLARAQRGDKEALSRLVERYGQAVYAVAGRMLVGRTDLVDDVAQEALVKVIRGLPRFDPRGPARLSTWIITVATRSCIDALRRQRRWQPLAEDRFAADDPEHQTTRRDLLRQVERAMADLSPEHRAVLVLRAFHDFDYREIAAALGLDEGTVKSRLGRARAALRRAVGLAASSQAVNPCDQPRRVQGPPAEQPFSAEEREALSVWQAPQPPADLAARVLERLQDAQQLHRFRRRRWIALGGLGAAAAALLLLGLWQLGQLRRPASGEAQVAVRTRLDLGGRAIAVAEQGAALSWRVERSGAATVQQRAGEVFFRVEQGGLFQVVTPQGTVSVLGTCFRVEVRTMGVARSGLKAAAAGAALATMVVVSVYEGKVLTVAADGRAEVGAGQVATLSAKGSPQVVDRLADGAADRAGRPSAVPSRHAAAGDPVAGDLPESEPELAAEANRLRQEVRALQQEVSSLKRGKRPDAFFAPTKEELLAMAERCEVRFDLPSMGLEPSQLNQERSEEIGLTEDETALINQTLAETQRQIAGRVRELFVEATGDKKGAESLAVSAMIWEIDDKSRPEARREMFRRLARERAGLQAPPADLASLPPGERLFRHLVNIGDALEKRLAEKIGPDLARRYREAQGNGFESRYEHNGCQ